MVLGGLVNRLFGQQEEQIKTTDTEPLPDLNLRGVVDKEQYMQQKPDNMASKNMEKKKHVLRLLETNAIFDDRYPQLNMMSQEAVDELTNKFASGKVNEKDVSDLILDIHSLHSKLLREMNGDSISARQIVLQTVDKGMEGGYGVAGMIQAVEEKRNEKNLLATS